MYDRVADGAAWLTKIHETIRAHEALVGGLAARPAEQWTEQEREALQASRNRIVFIATDSPIHTESLDTKTITLALLAALGQQFKAAGEMDEAHILFSALETIQLFGQSRHDHEAMKAAPSPPEG